MDSEYANKAFEEFDPSWNEKEYQKAEKEAKKSLGKLPTKKEPVYWESKNGDKIVIDDMSEAYVKNVLKLIITRGLLKDKLS